MIKLTFLNQRELMNFKVIDRNIYYSDKVWKTSIRLIPRDEEFIAKIRNSRNKYSTKLIEMFTLNAKQIAEYESAKTEEELANIIVKDCKKQGLRLLTADKEENHANN